MLFGAVLLLELLYNFKKIVVYLIRYWILFLYTDKKRDSLQSQTLVLRL